MRHPSRPLLALLLLGAAPAAAQGIDPLTGYERKAPLARPNPPRRPPSAAPAAEAAPVELGIDEAELRPAPDDPPALVGRIARVSGTVRQRTDGSETWAPARLNEALFGARALATGPGGRVALEFGRSRLFLDGNTELALAGAEDEALRGSLIAGALLLHLRDLEADDLIVEVTTADAVIETAIDGRLLIEALGEGLGTAVSVQEGAAEVTVGSERYVVAAGESLRIPAGAAPVRGRAGATTPLMVWAAGQAPRQPAPAVARGITGVDDLGAYGRWDRTPEYGEVWYPAAVPSGWVPYSDGAWDYQERFGWTWRDAAPWGFATSHYGRWVQVGPRWGWAPAPVRTIGRAPPRPVWSPALVAFFGAPPGRGFERPVGWVPLAPREPYYPSFRASPGYVARANARQVGDLAAVRRDWAARGPLAEGIRAGLGDRGDRFESFANRRAATLVDAGALRDGRDLRREARRFDPTPGDAGRIDLLGTLPVRPRGWEERRPERDRIARGEWNGRDRLRGERFDAGRDGDLRDPRERERDGRAADRVTDRPGREPEAPPRALRERDGDGFGDRPRREATGDGEGDRPPIRQGRDPARVDRAAEDAPQGSDRGEGGRPDRNASVPADPRAGLDAAAAADARRAEQRALRERLRTERGEAQPSSAGPVVGSAPSGADARRDPPTPSAAPFRPEGERPGRAARDRPVAPDAATAEERRARRDALLDRQRGTGAPTDDPRGAGPARGEGRAGVSPPERASPEGARPGPGAPVAVGRVPEGGATAPPAARVGDAAAEAGRAEALRARLREERRQERDAERAAAAAARPSGQVSGPSGAEAAQRAEPEASRREGDAAQREAARRREAEAARRDAADALRRDADRAARSREEAGQRAPAEAAGRAEAAQRAQAEAARRQAEAGQQAQAEAAQRQQAEAARRQAEAGQRAQAEAAQRQQAEAARRQAEAGQRAQAEAAQRQQAEAARRQAEGAQRAQAEAAQRQQAEAARRQAEAGQRAQAEAAQRQQAEAARRQAEGAQRAQAEAAQRQQAEAARRQAEAAQRAQAEATQRQQLEAVRRQAEAARAEAAQRQAEVARRQAELAQRAQAEAARRQQQEARPR